MLQPAKNEPPKNDNKLKNDFMDDFDDDVDGDTDPWNMDSKSK